MGAFPLLPEPAMPDAPGYAPYVRREAPPEDMHLRSTAAVTGYDIQAADGSIGHVKDFIFDDESWAIRYLVIDTRNWWPGGRKVLLATRWIDHIDWSESNVFTTLTREQVKASPEYDDRSPSSATTRSACTRPTTARATGTEGLGRLSLDDGPGARFGASPEPCIRPHRDRIGDGFQQRQVAAESE